MLKSITNSVGKPEITRGRGMSDRPYRHEETRESPLVLMEKGAMETFQKGGKKENRRNQQVGSNYCVPCTVPFTNMMLFNLRQSPLQYICLTLFSKRGY